MPLYVFRCPLCFFCMEVLQSYNTAPPLCPITEPPHDIDELVSMERTFSPFAARTLDRPTVRTGRSREGFKITTTDSRPRKERA